MTETTGISDICSTKANLSQLVRKRGHVKASLTRLKTYFDKIKLSQVVTRTTRKHLGMRLKSDEVLITEFYRIRESIDALSETSDPELERETEQFEETFYDIMAEIQEFLDIEEPEMTATSNNNVNVSNVPVQLPIIQLPKFCGKYEEWLEFRDLYLDLIHDCSQLSPIQKFHYLKASLQGSAAKCIKAIQFCGDNYEQAWRILYERFEDKEIMVHEHMKSIFNIRDIKSEGSSGLRDLVDDITKHLYSLNSLGVSTENWDLLLIYIVIPKLDSGTIGQWELREHANGIPTLEEFKSFLIKRSNRLDKINMFKSGKAKSHESQPQQKAQKTFLSNSNGRTYYACYVCKGNHSVYACSDFLKLSAEKRLEKVQSLKLCSNCLKSNHQLKDCRSGHCNRCNVKHHTLLHPVEVTIIDKRAEVNTSNNNQGNEFPIQSEASHCSYSIANQVLLATALVHIADNQGNMQTCRALLDPGSTSNFISTSFVNKLGISCQRVNISVSGIGQVQSYISSSCDVKLSSVYKDFTAGLHCLVIPKITDKLPNHSFDSSSLDIPCYVKLADVTFNRASEIQLLIGAETFWQLLCIGKINLGHHKPILQQTRLGWIISGSINVSESRNATCNLSSRSDIQSQLTKFWEVEEVSCGPVDSPEEALAEEHFLQTHKRDSSGRFTVSIPLKEPISKLGNSKEFATKQFHKLEKRLQANPRLKAMYLDFMREYQNLSHMSKVKVDDNETNYFSPHHGVLREDKVSTKLRVVFNSSAHSTSGRSYNSLQMVGPTIQEDLVSILLRFRQHSYVISGDICKMYRMILVDEQFRKLQLILWRESPEDELETFSLNTVTYGTASAPFLAVRCLKQLAIESQKIYPKASQAISRDFYVDDFLSGSESVTEVTELCNQVSSILKSGCFDLRKWKSNSPLVLENLKGSISSTDSLQFGPIEDTKTLGLLWSATNDEFSFKINEIQQSTRITKRIMLSDTARIFDPLGLLSPVIVVAKIMLQTLWTLNLSWDQELSPDLSKRWSSFRNELDELNSIKFPRHVVCKQPISVELHGFSDASQHAYGASLYVRSVDAENHIHVHLLCSKTRVAPIKSISIPRLELCAALLLSQLYKKVVNSLTVKFEHCYLWSDSTVALAWIRTPPHLLQTFVANRVAVIQETVGSKCWRYVPTKSNPADILSRGISPKAIKQSLMWFSGPAWLAESSHEWPEDISLHELTSALPELKKECKVFVQGEPHQLFPFNRFSSLNRLQRTAAYCLRFINNCQKVHQQKVYGSLSAEEIHTAMASLVTMSQRESFPTDYVQLSIGNLVSKRSKLLSLTPFLVDKIIRVGGRLKHSPYSNSKKHPAVLCSKHKLSHLIMRHEHKKQFHVGPQALLATVRENFWPINGKNLAKRVVRECVTCFKFKPVSPTPLMGNLPEPRIVPKFPFTDTGVDYAGFFVLKDRKGRGYKTYKCYLCLFICLATKAVHLEVVTELTTLAFLEALNRFIARRGKPSHVYSDNGTNFVGADNYLKELGEFLRSNCDNLIHQFEIDNIQWHFIASYSPHQGGLWEAGIKAAKYHIKRVIGDTLLTYEQFSTYITQIEGILNSRPLTPLSTDPNDLEVLTPSHFLIGRTLQAVPYRDMTNTPINRLSCFEHLTQLRQHFWSRWSSEYLSQLQTRSKWKASLPNIRIGTMVLLREPNQPPQRWRLGRILELHPGTDNVVRVVSIKTATGIVKRAVVKVCPVPSDV